MLFIFFRGHLLGILFESAEDCGFAEITRILHAVCLSGVVNSGEYGCFGAACHSLT